MPPPSVSAECPGHSEHRPRWCTEPRSGQMGWPEAWCLLLMGQVRSLAKMYRNAGTSMILRQLMLHPVNIACIRTLSASYPCHGTHGSRKWVVEQDCLPMEMAAAGQKDIIWNSSLVAVVALNLQD